MKTKPPPPANKLQALPTGYRVRQLKPRNGKPPLWKGPQEDGITFSLLSKFLNCRERFRKRVVEGLVEDEGFKHAMEYGSMWHEAEEGLSARQPWEPKMAKYYNSLIQKYPGSETSITKWYKICRGQFPLYVDYWTKHQDERGRQPLLEEVAFRVPYRLPSGRTVTLRGKWDAVMLLAAPTKKEPELYRTWQEHWPKAKFGITNQENKTKGEIDELGLLGTLQSNLQTMLYHCALRLACEQMRGFPPGKADLMCQAVIDNKYPITGVLYNVIRRPLADRFAIKQKKTETEKQFLERVIAQVAADPKHYFMRWRILLTPTDIEKFRREVFDPILEQLCDWWEWIIIDPFDPWCPRQGWSEPEGINGERHEIQLPNRIHWQAPWGVYDSLASGFRGDYFEYLTTGREFGLRRIKTLYPELEKE